jgi:hypothetical protein
MKKQGSSLVCPVCSVTWKQMPLLSAHCNLKKQKPAVETPKRELPSVPNVKPQNNNHNQYSVMLKVYNDDEPLISPTSGARFNPIPESDEENETGAGEFQGFFVNTNNNTSSPVVERVVNTRNVDFRLSPEVAVIAAGRSYETHAIVLKVKAPAVNVRSANRAPIDLVAVIDVSRRMNNEKLQKMKRAMRLVVSSLSNSDRLSIVAFSTNSKRLLSLRRMTTDGRRAARRIIEAVALLDGESTSNDALKKAAKVLEDRREKNSTASIILFSDDNSRSRRSSLMEIPVHSVDLNQSPCEDSFAKSVEDLISVVIQDLKLSLGFLPGEISGVYSNVDRPVVVGSGLIRIGDLYAEEERELLIEVKVKVPSTASMAQQILTVRSSFKDQGKESRDQALIVPRAVRSSNPSIQRLRSVFIATRAVAESRYLLERNDVNGAERMLSSARALLLQSGSDPAQDFARRLEAELVELNRTRVRSRTPPPERELFYVDEKGEPLTPTSAWRAAERLAKVAMMRKSLNRVSDLHGFEDARF